MDNIAPWEVPRIAFIIATMSGKTVAVSQISKSINIPTSDEMKAGDLDDTHQGQ